MRRELGRRVSARLGRIGKREVGHEVGKAAERDHDHAEPNDQGKGSEVAL
jgi:hypothetical protein